LYVPETVKANSGTPLGVSPEKSFTLSPIGQLSSAGGS